MSSIPRAETVTEPDTRGNRDRTPIPSFQALRPIENDATARVPPMIAPSEEGAPTCVVFKVPDFIG